jgi:hypothetical protein
VITARLARRIERAIRAWLVVVGLALPGCAPKLDPREYGEVIHELPKLPGAEEPYPLPELDEPTEKANAATK